MKASNSFLLSILLSINIIGCASTEDKDVRIVHGNVATSKYGMVSSDHPLATQAGLRVLENGGNAADAATAMAFTLAVVEPAMSGLGGRMQVIIRTAKGEMHGIDATTLAPMTYDHNTAPQAQYGYAVVGVPGMVAGASRLNKRFGKQPLEELMIPAINLANEGFYQLSQQALIHSRVEEQLLEFEGSKQYFIKPGTTDTYGTEDLLAQKDLGRTLQLIASHGPDVFYNGEIAEKMVEDVAGNGGALTMESLADYEALDAQVLKGGYRGYDIYGLWMPSFGAITIEILHILENLPMADFNEAERASAVYQAIKLAYEDRYRQTSLDTGMILISKEYAKELAAKINVKVEQPLAFQPLQAEPLAWSVNPGHTTHLTAADKDGMIVSLTQTIGPAMGSKVATKGLGFLYASTLGGYLGPMEPGQRAASHVSPVILTKNGNPVMGLGAAGGSRIPSAIVQAISRIIDNQMSPGDALAAPRVHPSAEGVILEMHDSLAWSSEDLEFLRANGFLIEEQKEVFRFGRVHMVMFDGTKWLGAADPDGEGTAAGPKID